MPKRFQSTNKRNECQVCGDISGKCRTTDTELVLCMNVIDAASTPNRWKFHHLSKGGGQWGCLVPSGQPESGNYRALRQQRAVERAAVEAARIARLKPKDIRDSEYRHQVANCPIGKTDQADLTRRGLDADDLATITPINDGRGGYIIPIRDRDGLMVGGQRRLDNVAKGGRYRWVTIGENQLPDTGELPLAHWHGSDDVKVVALVEGTGVKPYLAAKRLNALVIGAAGGNFVSSPQTLKLTLDQYSDLPVILIPDAGAVKNAGVMRQYYQAHQLLTEWGRELKVLWWGQDSKQQKGSEQPKSPTEQDIDEIDPDFFTTEMSWAEFAAIAYKFLKMEFLTQEKESNPEENSKNSQKTASDQILDIARTATYFHTADKVAYANVQIEGNRHTYSVRSRAFRLWLTGESFKSTGKGISSQVMQDTLSTLEAIAIFQGETHEVNLRVAEHQDKIYLDLGTPDWKAIEVDALGWRVVSDTPVMFWRPESLLALPYPIEGGSLEELRNLINVERASWTLIVTFLLFSFCPNKTYPVLSISAHRGSGKTAAAEILKGLIDPGKAPLIKPQDTRNLAVSATRRWMMVYDNVSFLTNEQSDDCCRLATGFGYSTRTLNTTDEETTFEMTRPQIITAIDKVVSRDDLADRVLMVQLPEISEDRRLPQSELNAKVEESKPRILGALLTALSQTLAELPNTKPDKLPRMADYALFAMAAEKAIGLNSGEFRATFDQAREESRQIVIEASPIGGAIIRLMENHPATKAWKGNTSELLSALERCTDNATVRSKYWPKAPNRLSALLTRLVPDLKALGILVDDTRVNGIRIFTINKKGSPPSPPNILNPISQAKKSGGDPGGDGGDPTPFSGDPLGGDTSGVAILGGDKKTSIATSRNIAQRGFPGFSGDGGDTFAPLSDRQEVTSEIIFDEV